MQLIRADASPAGAEPRAACAPPLGGAQEASALPKQGSGAGHADACVSPPLTLTGAH
jgi:hypothetical protein